MSVLTGLSDFHILVLTAFKTTFVKSKPKEISYRDYKHFNHESFEKDWKYEFRAFEKINYQDIEKSIHWNSKQACTYEKEVCKGKSGSLYDKSFTQSNYKKIGTRN